MVLREYANPTEFLDRASAFLEEHEAENSLILGLAAHLASSVAETQHAGFLATLEADGQVVAAALRTPPHGMVLTRAPALAIAILADHLARSRQELPGIIGPVESASLFITAWSKLSRQRITPHRSLRIHQLDRAIAPASPSGCFVEATHADVDVLLDWTRAFTLETGHTTSWDERAFIESALAEHHLFVWKGPDRVCMAAAAHPTPSGIRITMVYTPPEHRNRGYATATVAKLSQRLLDSGRRFCFLLTDLSNPTSNSIYRKIGYHPVADFREYRFIDASES